jgi:uncharacterized membrane protein YoaK (UPF0700 family)
MFTSFVIQTLFICIAASLVQSSVVPGIGKNHDRIHLIELLPLAFLSFQAGMQIVASRQLGLNEIPTVVLTSVYCDIANDKALFAPVRKNVKRNRRVGAVLSLLIGAIVGGWVNKSRGGMATALWMAAFVKACLVGAWVFWKSKEGYRQDYVQNSVSIEETMQERTD